MAGARCRGGRAGGGGGGAATGERATRTAAVVDSVTCRALQIAESRCAPGASVEAARLAAESCRAPARWTEARHRHLKRKLAMIMVRRRAAGAERPVG